jgi:hypothetical protein
MKKYDLVIGTGCSFMNGDAIHNEKMKAIGHTHHTPTKYLADKFGCEWVNLAQSGSSNDHMFSRILNYIENNNLENKKVLVIIGLSELARLFLKYYETKDVGRDLHPHTVILNEEYLYKTAEKLFNSDVKGLRNYLKFYMTHIFNEEFFEDRLGEKIILLKNYFQNKKIDFIIFNALSGHLNLENILDEENIILFDNEEKSWYISLKEKHEKDFGDFDNKEFRSPTPPWGRYFCYGHPSPHANQDLADLLYKKIVNNGWID